MRNRKCPVGVVKSGNSLKVNVVNLTFEVIGMLAAMLNYGKPKQHEGVETEDEVVSFFLQ